MLLKDGSQGGPNLQALHGLHGLGVCWCCHAGRQHAHGNRLIQYQRVESSAAHQHNGNAHAEQRELVALEARVLPYMVRRQAVEADRPAASAVDLCKSCTPMWSIWASWEQFGICLNCLCAVHPRCFGRQRLQGRPCASSNCPGLQQSVICHDKQMCQPPHPIVDRPCASSNPGNHQQSIICKTKQGCQHILQLVSGPAPSPTLLGSCQALCQLQLSWAPAKHHW